MRLFAFLAIFKYVGLPPPPPPPHDQCWKKRVEFCLFSHPHNIELGGKGDIYAFVSIIFAPDCHEMELSGG